MTGIRRAGLSGRFALYGMREHGYIEICFTFIIAIHFENMSEMYALSVKA